jgi:hypothetical protein
MDRQQGEICQVLRILLEWALLGIPFPGQDARMGFFPDIEILHGQETIVILDRFLPEGCNLAIAGRQLEILSGDEIRKRADAGGDFPYFSIEEAQLHERYAMLSVKLSWSVSEESVQAGKYSLGGGGVRVRFERVGSSWQAPDGPNAVWMA